MNATLIQNHLETVLRLMGVAHGSIEHAQDEGERGMRFLVRTDDAHRLIGQDGAALAALNHIIQRFAARGAEEESATRLTVDINGYRAQIEANLHAKARVLAERAKSLQADIEMEPLSSYERLLVHNFLASDANIATESKGEGRNRRVVIKYRQ